MHMRTQQQQTPASTQHAAADYSPRKSTSAVDFAKFRNSPASKSPGDAAVQQVSGGGLYQPRLQHNKANSSTVAGPLGGNSFQKFRQ